jgi:hypothetical protein
MMERTLNRLPGWLFVAVGLAILGAVLLTPAILDNGKTAWRLDLMRAQAAAMSEQAERYRMFHAAVLADDPVVLERLALTQLRETHVDKVPLTVRPIDRESANVGTWLAVRQPVIGKDLPGYAAAHNRVTRLAQGPMKVALLVVGSLCIIGGILFDPRPATATRTAEQTAGLPRLQGVKPASVVARS